MQHLWENIMKSGRYAFVQCMKWIDIHAASGSRQPKD